jgi:hypothetical protein
MRKFFCCLFTALALVAAPAFGRSDIVKRPVHFAKGKSGATIKDSLTGDQTRASQGKFNLSQADDNMSFSAAKEADLHTIRASNERYEIPEAVISGG